MWDLPERATRLGRVVGAILNDWQLAGVLTAGSGEAYDLGFSYQNNGGNVNLTGSPDYGARIVYIGDPGQRLLERPVPRSSTSRAVTGPTYNSTMMESGRNIMRGCPDKRVDMSLSRDIRLGGNRTARAPARRVQPVQHGHLQQPQREHPVQQPDRPDGPQLADAGGWLDRSGSAAAAQRRLRRGDQRAGACAACSSRCGSRSKLSPGRDSSPPLTLRSDTVRSRGSLAVAPLRYGGSLAALARRGVSSLRSGSHLGGVDISGSQLRSRPWPAPELVDVSPRPSWSYPPCHVNLSHRRALLRGRDESFRATPAGAAFLAAGTHPHHPNRCRAHQQAPATAPQPQATGAAPTGRARGGLPAAAVDVAIRAVGAVHRAMRGVPRHRRRPPAARRICSTTSGRAPKTTRASPRSSPTACRRPR